MLQNPERSRATLSNLISVAVEAAAKSGLTIDIVPETLRFLSENPYARRSFLEIQGEIALRASQWGAMVDFGPGGAPAG